MNFKFPYNNFIRDTKFFILKAGKYVIKIPFSLWTIKEARIEANNILQIEKDSFFSSYLLRYKCFSVIKVTPCLEVIVNRLDSSDLMEKYFATAFEDCNKWKRNRLKDLLDYKYFLEFIKNYLVESYDWWFGYLNRALIESSSAHGDFHADNILVKGEKLFFIDWARYRFLSSRYFDLIDFYIFFNRKNNDSWMDVWQREYGLNRIFKVNINNNHWIAYAIWKTAEELKTIYSRGDLEYKRKKYINFINKLKEIILQYE